MTSSNTTTTTSTTAAGTTTMNQARVYMDEDLGRGRRASFREYNGRTLLHLRLYKDGYPTKKGVCLSIDLARVLIALIPQVLQALENGTELTLHISNDIRLRVTEYANVDVRLFWYPPQSSEQVPTTKGINLRPDEFRTLADVLGLYIGLF